MRHRDQCSADVSKEEDAARIAEQTIEKLHHIDILVNSAAVNLPYRAVSDVTLTDWKLDHRRQPDRYLPGLQSGITADEKAAFRQNCQLFIHRRIIRSAGQGALPATKAAIINFTECLAAEVKEFGIDANTICPCVVETDMLRETKKTVAIPNIPMPPEEMAEVAVFLASNEAGDNRHTSTLSARGIRFLPAEKITVHF